MFQVQTSLDINGHMGIMGDVPARMLKKGTPEEVTADIKKLIGVVGEDSDFILSTGCDTPIDAEPENLRAMIETGRSYNPHHNLYAAADRPELAGMSNGT